MAEKIGNICSHGGIYEKEGEEKVRWNRHGTLLRTDKGLRIKLDSIPVGDFNGWLCVFEEDYQPQKKEEGGFRDKPKEGPEDEDDLPF